MQPIKQNHTYTTVAEAPLLITFQDAAVLLSVCQGTVCNLVRAGDLRAIKLRRTTRLLRSDVDKLVRRLIQQSATPIAQ